MLNMLKKLLLFRMGQKSTRGFARMLGFGRLGTVLGLLGGLRAVRHHHAQHRTHARRA
jgi:hypothetical protein